MATSNTKTDDGLSNNSSRYVNSHTERSQIE